MTRPPAPVARTTVRAAVPADFGRIGDLTVEAYDAADLMAQGYDTVLRDVAHRAAEGDVLVAERAGQVVGALLIPADGSGYAEARRHPEELEFRMLAVDPAAQGGGVGSALLDAVLATAVRRGRRRVVLSTLDSNEAARAIYAARGFVRAPERDFRPVLDVDLLVQVLDLPVFCPHCGAPASAGPHACRVDPAAARWEAPRHCPLCGRRVVVQVLPTGWTARCSRHGDLTPEAAPTA